MKNFKLFSLLHSLNPGQTPANSPHLYTISSPAIQNNTDIYMINIHQLKINKYKNE